MHNSKKYNAKAAECNHYQAMVN